MAILHVAPSNIYETLRCKTFVYVLQLFNRTLFALFISFWWKLMLMPLIAFITNRLSTTNQPLPHRLFIFIVALEKRCYTLFIYSKVYIAMILKFWTENIGENKIECAHCIESSCEPILSQGIKGHLLWTSWVDSQMDQNAGKKNILV